MSAIPRRKLSVEEYLHVERLAPFKSEFYDGEMYAMSGARYPHNRIKDNLIGLLHEALGDGPCFTLSSDMRVTTPGTPYYTYPDIAVVCGEAELAEEERDVLTNPRVIIEILSPSTEDYDRGFKRQQYQRIESLREYVLVLQDEARIEQFVRRDDGSWEHLVTDGIKCELRFESITAVIPFSKIYAGTAVAQSES